MIRYVLTIIMSLWVSSSLAQDCTKTHVVGNNETIFDIAQRYFGDPQKWSVINYGNQGKLNGALLQFAPGTELNIPCLLGTQVADQTPLLQDDAEMKLLTGSDYAPLRIAIGWGRGW